MLRAGLFELRLNYHSLDWLSFPSQVLSAPRILCLLALTAWAHNTLKNSQRPYKSNFRFGTRLLCLAGVYVERAASVCKGKKGSAETICMLSSSLVYWGGMHFAPSGNSLRNSLCRQVPRNKRPPKTNDGNKRLN